MVIVVESEKDLSKTKKTIAERHPKKKFDAHKFCGALRGNQDLQKIQQQLRDKWNQVIVVWHTS